jgi:hypothetical protein
MILYLKDLKNATKKLLDITKTFSKVAGYKINLQKSVAFLYTNNEQTEKEYRKNNSIFSSLKDIKYLGINLSKEVKDLYSESYKLLKEMETSPMLMDWQNQYENGYQSNLHVECNSHQNSNHIHHRD